MLVRDYKPSAAATSKAKSQTGAAQLVPAYTSGVRKLDMALKEALPVSRYVPQMRTALIQALRQLAPDERKALMEMEVETASESSSSAAAAAQEGQVAAAAAAGGGGSGPKPLAGVPFFGDPPQEFYSSSAAQASFALQKPGLTFIRNATPATGITVKQGNRPSVRKLTESDLVVDGGSNLCLATFDHAAEEDWATEAEGSSFHQMGPDVVTATHRVKGGITVVYAEGTEYERVVTGVRCLLVPKICHTSARVLLGSPATVPVGAYLDPVLQALRFRPFYGVNGSADARMCNLSTVQRYVQARPADGSAGQPMQEDELPVVAMLN
jgi:hypothetical protein